MVIIISFYNLCALANSWVCFSFRTVYLKTFSYNLSEFLLSNFYSLMFQNTLMELLFMYQPGTVFRVKDIVVRKICTSCLYGT